jgi:hypothetical protein
MNVLTIDCDWAITFKKQLEIINFFIKKINKTDTIFFTQEHHLFYNIINKGDKLFNLDHHHDLSYTPEQKKRAENKLIEASNWIYALKLHKKLNHYLWVGNYTSSFSYKENPHEITLDFKYFNFSHDIKDLYPYTYNKILICESKRFNKDAYCLYEILKNIAVSLNKKIKIIKTNNSQGYLQVK